MLEIIIYIIGTGCLLFLVFIIIDYISGEIKKEKIIKKINTKYNISQEKLYDIMYKYDLTPKEFEKKIKNILVKKELIKILNNKKN